MKKEKNSVELVLEGVEMTEEQQSQLTEKMNEVIDQKVDKRVAFILEKKLRDAKVNIYKAVKTRAKEAFMEAVKLVRDETQNDAKAFKQAMTEKLSDYLDATMKKHIPDNVIKEAAEARHYKGLVTKVKQAIVIDEVTKDHEVREAVNEANEIMKKLKGNNNKLIKEKIRLNNRCKVAEAELHLERKMTGLTDAQRTYVTEALKGKDVEEIDELFESTLKMMKETGKKDKAEPKGKAKTVTDNKIIQEKHRKAVAAENREKDPESIESDEMEFYTESIVKDN